MTTDWLDALHEAACEGRIDGVYFIGRDETIVTAAARISYRSQELMRLVARDSGLAAVARALGIEPEWREDEG